MVNFYFFPLSSLRSWVVATTGHRYGVFQGSYTFRCGAHTCVCCGAELLTVHIILTGITHSGTCTYLAVLNMSPWAGIEETRKLES